MNETINRQIEAPGRGATYLAVIIELLPADCAVHRRSHKFANAKRVFDELSAQVGKKWSRVLLHQGNLAMGSAKIHLETR